jgi:lambda family phage portal protein
VAELSVLDRLVGFVSPRAGAARLEAKLRMSAAARGLARSYDGAKTGRRSDGWTTTGSSANTALGPAAQRLRDRSRDLVRNSSWARRALQVMTANVIGDGIQGTSATGDRALDGEVSALWAAWCVKADADGLLDFEGLQALAFRAMLEGGDAFVRFRPRRMEDNLPVALQIQCLEADYLDRSRDSGEWQQGVQFDALGRRIAYRMWRQHPGDARPGALAAVDVPASEIVHLFVVDRPGQVIGAPWFAPVIARLRDLDDLQDAVLYREKINSAITGAIESPEDAGAPRIGEVSGGGAGRPQIDTVEPGTITRLGPGEKYTPAPPPATETNYAEFVRHVLLEVASGLGLTYDQLTGDLSEANYSSLRAGKMEQRRVVSQLQWQLAIPRLCQPVWDRFIAAALMEGKLKPREGGYPVRWIPPAHEYVDPSGDLEADLLAVASGRKTWSQLVQEAGFDPGRQAADLAADKALLSSAGVDLGAALGWASTLARAARNT